MDHVDSYREVLARYSAFCDSRTAIYAAIISKASPVLQEMRDKERERPPNFNIFLSLGHAYREVSTHSAMLAHLLDPAGSHQQGTLFLCSFLDIVQKASVDQGKHFIIPRLQDDARWRCRREVWLRDGLGQADILLRGPGLILVIENKIGAADQDKQLCRYWEYARTEAEKNSLLPVVVYLTPDGRAPTPGSVGGALGLDEMLVRLSYQQDIYELIMRTVMTVRAISVAEVLRQYADLVRRLT